MISSIQQAQSVATFAHEGQTRKGSDTPYITHPMAVAKLVQEQGATDAVVVAALLHDVLEDVPASRYSKSDMMRDFGDVVVALVEGVSETKLDTDGTKISWINRKTSYIKTLENGSDETALISLADKVHNLSSFLEDYSERGEAILQKFNSTPETQHWYYATLIKKVFIPRFGEQHPLVTRLTALVDRLVHVFHLSDEVDIP